MSDSTIAERFRALADPTSTYFRNVSTILRQGAVAQRRAEEQRMSVVLPFAVSPDVRLGLERKFGWKLVVKDYGIRGRLTPELAALSFLMGFRNALLMGSDGEEAIYLDGDLPAMVAKGVSYGHVCRTNATPRLVAGYAFEEVQLRHMAKVHTTSMAAAAAGVLQDLEGAVGTRVCNNAAVCRRAADVILINHVQTPVSLAQAVATARAHGAVTIRGVCFFQPEMLAVVEGDMAAFAGRFIVDREMDVISFLPEADGSMGFSHPYSSLVSFFLNHEYVDDSGKWVVEKHLSGDGIFHYIVRKAEYECVFAEELSANYYSHDLTRWVELSYPSFEDVSKGVVGREPVRTTVRILEHSYEKTVAQFLAIDAKRLTLDEVCTALRNHNNTVVCAGDIVRKPVRVWAEVESKAAVPILAMIQVRRETAAYELREAMGFLKKKYASTSRALLTCLWSVLVSKVGYLRGVALSTLSESQLVDLTKLCLEGVDMSVKVDRVPEYTTVRQLSGVVNTFRYGRMESWLPGGKVRSFGLLSRALAKVGRGRGMPVRSGSADVVGSSDVTVLESSNGHGGVQKEPLGVAVHCSDEAVEEIEVSDARRALFDKLVAQQDALNIGRPPRYVERFETLDRIDVAPVCPLVTDPVVVGQGDYDRIYPGVSLSDEENKAYAAAESDFEKSIDFTGSVNDSKRMLPESRCIRRSRIRAGGAGPLPRCQSLVMSALFKRNAGVPAIRGYVDLLKQPQFVVDKVIDVCFVHGWQALLARELEAGLWIPVEADVATYVPKVPTHQIKMLMEEFVSCADEDLSKWLLMVKSVAKPPLDLGAGGKVQLPQTIMYSSSKGTNAKYSAMQTRFYNVMKSMLRPNVSFNNRDSPAEHEIWFNSCQPLRETVESVYRYEGDLFCYDRSQEDMAQVFEMCFYRRMGLDAATLYKWSETHGVKKATSMMFGIVMYVMQQGLSGIWKTLFRNGLLCLGAVVVSLDLSPQDIISLDVVGDDFCLEANRPVQVGRVVEHFALEFNLTAKFFGVDVAYMCSKYWVRVDGWWYYMADPVRKFESISNAVVASNATDDKLAEKWQSLRDDLRHYDNGIAVEALAVAVKVRMGLDFEPLGLIRALSTLASDRSVFIGSYGPEEMIG